MESPINPKKFLELQHNETRQRVQFSATQNPNNRIGNPLLCHVFMEYIKVY